MKLNRTLSLVLLILIIGALFRFSLLNTVPPGIHPDAAADGLDAWQAYLTHHHPVFYPSNFGREGLFINLISYSFQLFGPTLTALKLPGIIIGLLTVLGMYFLGYEVTRKKSVGLFASFFTAISLWLVIFDRMGFRATLSVDAVVWASFFFLRALRLHRWYDYAVAGIFLGIGLNSYLSFRILPAIFVFIFVWRTWADRRLSGLSWEKCLAQQKYFLLTVFISAILVTPLGLYYLHHPGSFSSRSSQVSVFDQPHTLKILAASIGANLSIFTFFGDPNWRHNFSTLPILDTWQSLLFFLGIIITWRIIFRSHQKLAATSIDGRTNYLFILLLFAFMIVPAAVTYSPGGIPHALRLIDSAPAVYVLVAIAIVFCLEKTQQAWPDHRRLIRSSVIVMVIYMTLYSAVLFFGRWGYSYQVAQEYGQDFAGLARYIATQAHRGQNVYIVQNSSEVDFLTLNLPHVLKVHYFDQTSVQQFQPTRIVYSNFRTADLSSYKTLQAQGWHNIPSQTFGRGGHDIRVLEK